MTISSEDLRETMRFWATGVAIVTSQYQDQQHGMTVNSFTSVSLTPPLVLVSLERSTRTQGLVRSSGHFGITVLSAGQIQLSERFAGRQTEMEDRLAGLDTFILDTGVPFLTGGLCFLDCRVETMYDIATHTLFIGEVTCSRVDAHGVDEPPLIYFNRDYRRLAF